VKANVSESHVSDDQLVERVHACLADALRRTRPEPNRSPVTVAEIYQDLVPYRSIRAQVGFSMNADYEHTLLRLLSGEGGYARLEPSEAREELRAELESPNPNVGLFRKFAACDVWVTVVAGEPDTSAGPARPRADVSPPAVESISAEALLADENWGVDLPWEEQAPAGAWNDAEPELLLEEEVELTEPAIESAPEPAAASPEPPNRSGAASMHETKSMAATANASGEQCAFCNGSLPAGRIIRYCPFCGMDQAMQPCASCSEPLQADWKFCVACGAPQG
jgi:hypothetical protein